MKLSVHMCVHSTPGTQWPLWLLIFWPSKLPGLARLSIPGNSIFTCLYNRLLHASKFVDSFVVRFRCSFLCLHWPSVQSVGGIWRGGWQSICMEGKWRGGAAGVHRWRISLCYFQMQYLLKKNTVLAALAFKLVIWTVVTVNLCMIDL